MQPLPAPAALNAYFLEARSKLLDVAAFLDRVQRGPDADGLAIDPRLTRIRAALEVLLATEDGRAEQIQKIFSFDYDPLWKVPQPR